MELFELISGNKGKIVVLYFFILLFISCQGVGLRGVESNEKMQADTLEKDIPLNKKGAPYSYYRNKTNVENKIGLRTIEDGFDSLQVRVWYAYASNDTSQLFIMKREEGDWYAELYTLIYRLNENSDSLLSIDKSVVVRSPKSGWNSFSERILKLGITSLPDSKKIVGYPDFADGNSIIVEVSSKSKYRIYTYKEPDKAKAEIKEALTVEEILELIENEFDFYRLRNI